MLKDYLKILIVLFVCLFLSACQFSSKETKTAPLSTFESKSIIMNSVSNNTPYFSPVPSPDATDVISDTVSSLSLNELMTIEINNPKIIVYKEQRNLYLYDGDIFLSVFDIGLGFTPEGAKTTQGDGKTPEGEYYICYKNPKSKFYLSIGLSYPNISDASAALSEGRIDQKTYNKIEAAINAGKRPPWDTSLGGEIMIHGHGSQSDWTAGCIAVDDEIMDLLYKICDIDTPVIINK